MAILDPLVRLTAFKSSTMVKVVTSNVQCMPQQSTDKSFYYRSQLKVAATTQTLLAQLPSNRSSTLLMYLAT